MIIYKDIKSVAYIDEIIGYVQDLLSVRFKRYGRNNFAAFCPFHDDTKDSFRVYLKDKEEVRFHCFGACNAEWDVYNLIMLRKGCGFKQAQIELAKVLGVDEFEMFHGKSDSISEKEEEPDEPLNLSEPEELTPELGEVLDRGGQFYHSLLMSDGKQFVALRKYLDT
jgi:DNA primase